ncbi:MAG: hypothetical protein WBW32_10635 [Luteibacter sp.]
MEDPEPLKAMAHPLGSIGPSPHIVRFDHAPFSYIPPHSFKAFDEIVIITGESGVRIDAPDNGEIDRCVLTGVKGRHNDCLILFRHAYGTVTCELGVGDIAADAHIGFLQCEDFAEVRTFSYTMPRERRRHGDAGFWTTLQYSAKQLNELQGIVWRGGTLCIEQITLEP